MSRGESPVLGLGVGWMLMESLHLAMSKMSLTLMEESDSGK